MEEAGMSRSRRFVVAGSVAAIFSVLLGAGAGSGQGTVAPPPSGSGTGAHGLVWAVPAGWTTETPTSTMRKAQYKITGPGGPAECVVFYFGPGQGGDAKANATRWIGQFRRPDGAPAGDAGKTRDIKVGDVSVTMVEVSGTFVGGMGGGPSGPERPNQMLLGAIVPGADANWFFRAIGPRTTLEPQKAAFEKMIRSIKRGS
jgi:hypothetical protein